MGFSQNIFTILHVYTSVSSCELIKQLNVWSYLLFVVLGDQCCDQNLSQTFLAETTVVFYPATAP